MTVADIIAETRADAEGGTGSATFSPTRLYRYTLGRSWGDGPTMAWLMLNPSTADAFTLDPTIRRCVGFAKREGCGAIVVLNLYALRATNPRHLLDHPDPEGPGNAAAWDASLGGDVGPVVAAWGAHASMPGLPESTAPEYALTEVPLLCLGMTKDGYPRHPLYVRADAPLVPWCQL